MKRNSKEKRFVICIRNEGYEVSLELRKIYQVLPDAPAERHHLLRILDESGEDYLYPQEYFLSIAVPPIDRKALTHGHSATK